jgi:DNA-binding Lrp family transcriptional regulator
MARFDSVDALIALALDRGARTPVIELASRIGVARRTVQHRLNRQESEHLLRPHSDRVPVEHLGYTVQADICAEVRQARLEDAAEALRGIPEVLQASATTGGWDLTCRVAARDTADLYRVGQQVLACPGVVRTSTSVLIRDLVAYRTTGLLQRHARTGAPRAASTA